MKKTTYPTSDTAQLAALGPAATAAILANCNVHLFAADPHQIVSKYGESPFTDPAGAKVTFAQPDEATADALAVLVGDKRCS